jgi:branched-chain amino acid transport system substrate-binding protein
MSKTNKIILWLVVIIVAIGLIWLGYSDKEVDKDKIKIGVVLHLTGDQSEPAQAFLEGIKLATDEINKEGGILNKEVKIIVEDDQLKTEKAHSSAVKLINIDKINVGINASFLESMANGPLFENAKIPVITLWDSAKEIEDIGEYVFGIGIWTPSAGESAAEFAYNELNLRKMAVVNILNEWSQSVSNIFTEKFIELGGQIVEEHSVNPDDTNDFKTIILKIKNSQADGIYSPITDGVTIFYKQLGELTFDSPIITSDIITENHIDVLGSFAEGIYQTQALEPEGEKTERMKNIYKEKYGKDIKQTLFVAWGYDAVFMIKEAIEKGESDNPEDIKNNLYNIKDFEGVSGLINIDENGSSKTLEKVFQIKNGKFIFVK